MGKMRKVNQGTRGNFEDRKRAQVLIFGEKEIKNEIFKRIDFKKGPSVGKDEGFWRK